MAEQTCAETLSQLDPEDRLHCVLPASHTAPTGGLPQGSPHESAELDSLTGDPRRWWGP